MTQLVSAPYTHSNSHISKTMILVMLALLPATLFGFYQFGLPSIWIFLVTILSCVTAEVICLYIAGKRILLYLNDGSAILTGWLLAMTLPPWAPWWLGCVGGLIAIILGKQVFGGIGQNLFNPAMVARVVLLISFPLEMTSWVAPHPLFSSNTPGFFESLNISFNWLGSHFDVMTSATLLGHVKTELSQGISLSSIVPELSAPVNLSIGNIAGSMGETSAVLILLGGLFLIYKKIISWHIPLSLIASLFIISAIFHWMNPERYLSPELHILSGATLLTAFFIATDLVTSPITKTGQLIFGFGCALFAFVIRSWTPYPEGFAFAVMLMNGFTPIIDHYIKPRIYGRDRKGEPLSYNKEKVANNEG